MDKKPLVIGRVAFAKALCADWMVQKRRVLLATLLTLLILCACLFQLSNRLFPSSTASLTSKKQFYSASLRTDIEELSKLEASLKKDPFLRAKLGQSLAQKFLAVGDIQKAHHYAKAAFQRTHDLNSSYYARFANNTFAIVNHDYKEALREAKQLKTDLEQDLAFWDRKDKFLKSGSILYAYNLIRIASLERALGSQEGELVAWNEFVQNAGWEGAPKNPQIYDQEAYSLVASNFNRGEVSLLDFIKERKKILSSVDSTDVRQCP